MGALPQVAAPKQTWSKHMGRDATKQAEEPDQVPAPAPAKLAADPASGDIASGNQRPATIYDVAREAGVSHQTVTRVLKDYPSIRPHTRERVLEALERLDYRPNLTARSLTTGRSHRIGALTHELQQFGPSSVAQGAAAQARESGYLLDIVSLDMSDVAEIEQALDLLHQHDLAGVLALSSNDEMTEAFGRARFRVPAYIATEEDEPFSAHPSELTTVGFPALVNHLAELGHREFLHVAGPEAWMAARNRARAYTSALEARGLHSAGTIHGDWSARSGYEAIAGLGRDIPATAIVAANDQTALGVLRALHERGLKVPEDVSVTGVDDIPDAAYFTPPLTTLQVDFETQGRNAVQQLLSLMNHSTAPETTTLPSRLVVRRSTGPAARR
ncbi:LacI family transcriptional regulator [Promicromonospora soli]|uniref:LacI family transcriptional regulator n=2 Tax=Promicromonospora soli TaxID=2035533 RepID=A0A919FZ06_9MICO|nr:LacI family transcriptional regulator [Promicromonospora soli]